MECLLAEVPTDVGTKVGWISGLRKDTSYSAGFSVLRPDSLATRSRVSSAQTKTGFSLSIEVAEAKISASPAEKSYFRTSCRAEII